MMGKGGVRVPGEGKKLGAPIKKEKRKKLSITLPMGLVEWLRAQDLSQAKMIEKALRHWIEK